MFGGNSSVRKSLVLSIESPNRKDLVLYNRNDTKRTISKVKKDRICSVSTEQTSIIDEADRSYWLEDHLTGTNIECREPKREAHVFWSSHAVLGW